MTEHFDKYDAARNECLAARKAAAKLATSLTVVQLFADGWDRIVLRDGHLAVQSPHSGKLTGTKLAELPTEEQARTVLEHFARTQEIVDELYRTAPAAEKSSYRPPPKGKELS